ncbi:MAG: ShlB/FhaC/HecB family hemolysin secretion/activation protein [Methylococcaceae bacterium]|nr:ShlB/FhaC/HecB family hemolysin secretion/activation protein [Methylococcaceae bacterium]MDP3903976.1 ShlB/FhaC/HecB family hemolysin secretion/activation protein [Methylococcaceae bacterium]
MQLKRIKTGLPLIWLVCCAFTVVGNAFAEQAAQSAPANVEAAQDASAEQQAAPEQPATFDLLELRVKGNNLIDKKQLERTIYPFLGLKKSVDNVEAARATLEELYKTQGYQTVSVDIPEQDVKNGIVYLQVVEGKISKLRVKDARYFSLGKIKAAVPELAEGNVPNFPKMQKQLAELGIESPDRQIQPVLRAGDTPGTLEVDLKVKDELPLHGKVELNGRNTSTTSRLRLVSSLRYENLWQAMHSASLMYQVSPENSAEVDVWAGTYALPLFSSDARLAFYGVSSSSSAQIASAGALSVIGIGNIYGLRLVKPLTPINDYFHSATLGVDYKDFQEDVNLIGADNIKTPISYLPFMAQYSGSLRTKESETTFDVGAHFSFRGLLNDQKQFEDKRFLAKANYLYLTGDLRFQHELPFGMEAVSRVAGQVSDTPLISNEQFSMGGAESVRGYFETQSLADDALFGSLELHSPHLGAADWDYLNNLKLLTFVDVAKGWVKNPLPGNSSGDFISSAGIGMNFQMWKHLSGVLNVGFPFNALGPVKSGDPRLHFNIATDF